MDFSMTANISNKISDGIFDGIQTIFDRTSKWYPLAFSDEIFDTKLDL